MALVRQRLPWAGVDQHSTESRRGQAPNCDGGVGPVVDRATTRCWNLDGRRIPRLDGMPFEPARWNRSAKLQDAVMVLHENAVRRGCSSGGANDVPPEFSRHRTPGVGVALEEPTEEAKEAIPQKAGVDDHSTDADDESENRCPRQEGHHNQQQSFAKTIPNGEPAPGPIPALSIKDSSFPQRSQYVRLEGSSVFDTSASA